jgi:diguanylate cyclase (GGDEF)-like protein
MQHPSPSRDERDTTWKLLRDDIFDRIHTDAELDALVERIAAESDTPYADAVRHMVGLDGLEEIDARGFYRRIVEHWRRLSRVLGRSVHVRVAALDLLTYRPPRAAIRRDSRPIIVTPSLIERALSEARTDAVTGLPQRAHFMGLLRHELRQRKRRDLAVVYIDLDGFKRVNDTYGHAKGDEVLRLLSRVGRATMRHGDVIARIGGDEFALLLLDLSLDEANTAVARLRQRFEVRASALGVSFSAGVVLAEPGDSPEAVLARADAAMYRDKRARAARG